MHGVYQTLSSTLITPRERPEGYQGKQEEQPLSHPSWEADRLPKMLPVPGKSYPGDDVGRERRLGNGNWGGESRHPRKMGVGSLQEQSR